MNSRISDLVPFCHLISKATLVKAKAKIYSTYINWNAGDAFNYTITKDKEKPKQGYELEYTSVESKVSIITIPTLRLCDLPCQSDIQAQ